MTACAELLIKLKELNIKVSLDDGNLKINAPKGSLTDELKISLRDNKKDLLRLLSENNNQGQNMLPPINAVDRSLSHPLSFAQQRLWFLDQVNPDLYVYNIPLGFRVTGEIDFESFNLALNQVIARQDTLRTCFRSEDSDPTQEIMDSIDFQLSLETLKELSNPEEQLTKRLVEKSRKVFQLDSAPLFDACLFQLEENEHYFFFNAHHSIFDGGSIEVLLAELTELYSAAVEKRSHNLEEIAVHYLDYSVWQREWMESEEIERQRKYWIKNLENLPDPIEIPVDKARPEIQEYEGAIENYCFSSELVEKLSKLAIAQDSSIFMTLLSLVDVLLYKYSGAEDILVGTPIASRNQGELNKLIGYFANTLVLRSQVNPEKTFIELLTENKETCFDAYANQDLPFDRLVEAINPPRDPSRSPLFQVFFAYQDASQHALSASGLKFVPESPNGGGARTDLTLDFINSSQGMEFCVEYSTSLFEKQTIKDMIAHFDNLLRDVVSSPEKTIDALSMLADKEKQEIVASNQSTFVEMKDQLFVSDYLSDVAAKNPNKIAVTSGDESLSYQDLEDRSNKVANYLLSKGVGNGTLVGLCVDRSVWMLTTLLGILKVGCAYVPLDPEYPEDRLAFMIEDAELRYLITQDDYLKKLPEVKNTILLDELIDASEKQTIELAAQNIDDQNLAYIIYTSGSTGKPKGVMVHRRAVNNFLNSMSRVPGLSADDTLLAVTTLSFDIAVLELYLPLMLGAGLVIAKREEAIDGRRLLKIVKDKDITCMQATPATWRVLMGAGWTSENKIKVLCGGEALPKDLAKDLFDRSTELWNMYGPTETTVWSTCKKIEDPSATISLGEAIENTTIYVLDESQNLLPKGVAGELFIGGEGVTLGYWNREKLTEERFLNDPFAGSGKLYRTGDKVRFRRDGELEYLGRLDSQVKLRGFRIELGEIETTMRKHENIEDCALAIKEPVPGDVRLVAYIVWAGNPVTLTELRKFLKQWMPAHMIPQTLVDIDVLPRTPNGKLDRKGLPDVFTSVTESASFVEPNTDVSRWLAKIWQEVIGVNQVGLNDNFFDAGGHSLLSMQVIYKIKHQYEVSLSPRDLLLETLEQQANKIQKSLGGAAQVSSMQGAKQLDEVGSQKDDEPEGKKKKGFMSRLFK